MDDKKLKEIAAGELMFITIPDFDKVGRVSLPDFDYDQLSDTASEALRKAGWKLEGKSL